MMVLESRQTAGACDAAIDRQTVRQVRRWGRQKEHLELWRGREYAIRGAEAGARGSIKTIERAGRTGPIGDDKVSVMGVEDSEVFLTAVKT